MSGADLDGRRSGWIFPSPSALTPLPLVCTWAGLRLAAEQQGAVAGGIEVTITGGEISGAGAGASLPGEGNTPQGDTREEGSSKGEMKSCLMSGPSLSTIFVTLYKA